MISVSEKEDFLRYFLSNFNFKKKESVWILNYFLSNDELLKKIHFIDEYAYRCPRGLVLETSCYPRYGAGLKYYYDNGTKITTNADEAFYLIRTHRNEDLYIELRFNRKHIDLAKYYAVIEENPFINLDVKLEEYSEEAEKILEKAFENFKRDKLMFEIDEALKAGDKERFLELSSRYKKLLNH